VIWPASLEIFRSLFCGIAEEMGTVLERSALSPNIKERRDFSCAIFDANGSLLAQASHIPVHLGAMPALMEMVCQKFSLSPGDVLVTNDPFLGGTHLPDITLISPVFLNARDAEPFAFLVSRAHHSDVGGKSPGSMPLSKEIFQEGFLIPPELLVSRGSRVDAVWSMILRNVRTPGERKGDLEAQLAAHRVGEERFRANGIFREADAPGIAADSRGDLSL